MNKFKALRIHRDDGRIQARFEQIGLDDLSPGEVVVRVGWSGINYKDALAATGTSPILRRYPLVGGIDLAGEVVSSSDARYSAGQKVLVTGCGLSETHDGGYAEYARLSGDWLIELPAGHERARRDDARHRRFHRGARDPPHGAERAAAGRWPDRGDRGDRWRRQSSPSTCWPGAATRSWP